MSVIEIAVLAVGLSMDAFAVAVAISAARGRVTTAQTLRLAAAFGLFQFVMPIIGWFAGKSVVGWISSYDHWVAFGLLAFIGGKMIYESFMEENEEELEKDDPTKGLTLLTLSIATSIDALAVGLSFAMIGTKIVFPSALIGAICFSITAIGMKLGGRIGEIVGKRMELVGGLVLIGIGVKILAEHLSG